LTNRIAVNHSCGVPRFRCHVSKLLGLFLVTMPRKWGKIKGVRWLVLVKSQIIGYCICLILIGLNYTDHRQVLNDRPKAQILPIGSYRWTIRSVSPTDQIIRLVWMHLYLSYPCKIKLSNQIKSNQIKSNQIKSNQTPIVTSNALATSSFILASLRFRGILRTFTDRGISAEVHLAFFTKMRNLIVKLKNRQSFRNWWQFDMLRHWEKLEARENRIKIQSIIDLNSIQRNFNHPGYVLLACEPR